jgi:hypothetical protein
LVTDSSSLFGKPLSIHRVDDEMFGSEAKLMIAA